MQTQIKLPEITFPGKKESSFFCSHADPCRIQLPLLVVMKLPLVFYNYLVSEKPMRSKVASFVCGAIWIIDPHAHNSIIVWRRKKRFLCIYLFFCFLHQRYVRCTTYVREFFLIFLYNSFPFDISTTFDGRHFIIAHSTRLCSIIHKHNHQHVTGSKVSNERKRVKYIKCVSFKQK